MNSSRRTIAIDTAKRVFFLHGENEFGKVILREKLTRERLLPYLANQPASTIAIEEADQVISNRLAVEDSNQINERCDRTHLMTKQVRPAPLDSGNDTGDTKRR